jgi:hypothetical protein
MAKAGGAVFPAFGSSRRMSLLLKNSLVEILINYDQIYKNQSNLAASLFQERRRFAQMGQQFCA